MGDLPGDDAIISKGIKEYSNILEVKHRSSSK